MARSGHRWTAKEVARLTGRPCPRIPEETSTGSQRVGGRYVQRGTAGKREALGGLFVRSRYEACYALYLRWQQIPFEYEPRRFEFPGIKGRNYSILPDFYLTAEDRYVEIKGWMDRDSRIRIQRFRKWYPLVRLDVVDHTFFRALCRQRVCQLIPAYECRHRGDPREESRGEGG